MRIPSGGNIYDFTVLSHISDASASASASASNDENENDALVIGFVFRKGTEVDIQRTFRIERKGGVEFKGFMSELLGEYQVPSPLKSDMADHFKFYLDRSLRIRRPRAPLTFSVNLHVNTTTTTTTPTPRRLLLRRAPLQQDETAAVPAQRAAVEALERTRVTHNDDNDRECAICLEGLVKGGDIIKMPCSHVYHDHCITRWLHKNHCCPSCRFNLPC